MRYVFIIICTSLIFISCEKSSEVTSSVDSKAGTRKVMGKLVFDNQSLVGASVKIDSTLNWCTTTDTNGEFKINGVTEGTHTFQANKALDNGSTVSQNTSISVAEEDLLLDTIRLPLPSILYPIDTAESTSQQMTLNWTPSMDPEFREYKIYRKTTAGLDETTGELVNIATNIYDTTFVDNTVKNGIVYYYRVYTLSSFGKLGGSNMVHSKTPPKNFVVNGSFENSSDGKYPTNWSVVGNRLSQNPVALSSTVFKEGARSLVLQWNDSLDVPHIPGDVSQTIPTTGLVIGSTYKFSFWAKVELGKIDACMSDNGALYYSQSISPNQDWTYYEYSFTYTGSNGIYLLFTHDIFGFLPEYHNLIKGYVDDVRLVAE